MSENENNSNDNKSEKSSDKQMENLFNGEVSKIDIVFDVNDLLEHWSQFTPEQRHTEFAKLHRTDAEEFFLNLNAADQYELIGEYTLPEQRSWLRLLAPDDAADLIQEAQDGEKENKEQEKGRLFSLLDPQTKREVNALLAYAEDNAGGIMNSRFIRLRPHLNVDEAISYIRIQAKTQVETIYYAYVLSPEQRLLGVVSFRELFAANGSKKIEDIMHTDVIQIPVDLDQEQIGQLFAKYEFMAIPVIDVDHKMVGIVTFDDVATAVQEEATEDIHKIGGMEFLDAPYMQISFLEMLKKRAGWLMILFVGEMFTATAMGYFQHELEKAVVLSMFIPLIISSGGNSGSQASTLIIRAMALGEVKLRDWWRVFIREVATGAALGLCLGVIGLIRIILWPWREQMYGEHYVYIAITIAISVLGCVLWGTITGSMLPFLLRKLKLDPASASAPAVATIVDVAGLVIYFAVANVMLSGMLL